jgi:hypothetical protein
MNLPALSLSCLDFIGMSKPLALMLGVPARNPRPIPHLFLV